MSEIQPGNKKPSILRWLPGLIISAIAIYAIVHFTRGQDIGAAFRSVKPGFILMLLVTILTPLGMYLWMRKRQWM